MKKIGICGGMGSGKSLVSNILCVLGIPVYIADDQAKRIMLTSQEVRESLVAVFGSKLYPNGTLDKAYVASLIFNSPSALQQTSRIIHPAVFKDFESWVLCQKGEIVGVESAILFESGFDRHLDYTVAITAPEEIRIARSMKRSGLSREQIMARLRNQYSEKETTRRADFVIVNDEKRPVIPQIFQLIQVLKITNSGSNAS